MPADSPSQQPDDHNPSGENNSADSGNDAVKTPGNQEVPPGMLPLVEPVFGDGKSWWAFLITAVPFLVYLAGTSFGTQMENIRKTAPAHDMRGYCRSMSDQLKESIERLPAADAEDVKTRLDLEVVQTSLDDESSEVSVLVQNCATLLNSTDSDFVDVDLQLQGEIRALREYVSHFYGLEAMVEEDRIDEIRPAYAEFLESQNAEALKLNSTFYPYLYSFACLTALVAILFAFPGYLKQPFRVTPFAVGVGVVGIVVWLGLWWLDKEYLHIGAYFGANSRAGFNPWEELKDTPTWMYTFMGIRLLGLCLVIPLAEEFFSRGFLMRYIEDIDWDQIPIGEATWKGIVGIIAYGAMTHPGEIVAAVAWFGLITWMYLKTKNIWDCVVAHSVTNTLLAVYVLTTDTWELW